LRLSTKHLFCTQAEDLKLTCNDFMYCVGEFKRIADSFIDIFDAVSNEVEKEKISAIGGQNLLQTSAKHRETQIQQLTAMVSDVIDPLHYLTVISYRDDPLRLK